MYKNMFSKETSNEEEQQQIEADNQLNNEGNKLNEGENFTNNVSSVSFCQETGEIAKKEANLLANLIGRSGFNEDDSFNQRAVDIWMNMEEVDLLEIENEDEAKPNQESGEPEDERKKSNQIDLNTECRYNHLDKVRDEMNINLMDDCCEKNAPVETNPGDDLLSLVDSTS
uniref:Uncharacterized protein n=1 Tax=Tetranychus urticae TaxID=32264 RepID=T1KXR3_TETUR